MNQAKSGNGNMKVFFIQLGIGVLATVIGAAIVQYMFNKSNNAPTDATAANRNQNAQSKATAPATAVQQQTQQPAEQVTGEPTNKMVYV